MIVFPSALVTADEAGSHPALELVSSERPLIIAHRGYSGEFPENTLPAFDRALEAAADLVELDYWHSQDGVPVTFHDRTLDRTTDARQRWGGQDLAVGDYPWERLKELDAGSWFGEGRFAEAGIRIPTLRESIERIQTGSVTLVERKGGDAATCVELVRELGFERELVVQAFDWRFLKECRERSPDLVLGALGPPRERGGVRLEEPERFLDEVFLDEIEAAGAQVVGWNRLVTAEGVEAAHRRGIRVWIYTVNDGDEAVKLVRMGVDGIITDFPTRIREALAGAGLLGE